MAQYKKKKATYKTLRQQQTQPAQQYYHQYQQIQQNQHQYQQRNPDRQRLKAEQIGSSVHDESDTMSFRGSLLNNFILSSEWLDALTTQYTPTSKIRIPHIYPSGSLNTIKKQLEIQIEQISSYKNLLSHFKFKSSTDADFYAQSFFELSKGSLNDSLLLNKIEKSYEKFFKVKVKPNRIVMYNGKFHNLCQDKSQAPPGYWERDYPSFIKYKQELSFMKQKQLEQESELKHQGELLEEQDGERQNLLLQRQEQQIQNTNQLEFQNPTHKDEKQLLTHHIQVQNSTQNHPQQQLESMFKDLGNEPFNTIFDDTFKDLDTAFF